MLLLPPRCGRRLGDVVPQDLEGVNEQVLDIRPAPGEQVIQTTDVVAVSEKPLAGESL